MEEAGTIRVRAELAAEAKSGEEREERHAREVERYREELRAVEAKAKQRGEEAVAAAEHAKRATQRARELEQMLTNARGRASTPAGGGGAGGVRSPFPDYRPLSPPSEEDERKLTRSVRHI